MKPYINEEIKDNPLYLSIQDKVRKEIKQYTLDKVVYVTLDQDPGGEFTTCLWEDLPLANDYPYWEEDRDDSLITIDIVIETLSTEEKQFIKKKWTMLIWQIEKKEENK
jgi:hypothetical protein